jgi:amino acid adenylation domain-containing protein
LAAPVLIDVDQNISDSFDRQVGRMPESAALVFHEQSLSYRQLGARVSRLAQKLRSIGIGPEMLVGVFIDRSVEMVVAILAILKSGAAYLPLDPSYPSARTKLVLDDSRADAVVTTEGGRLRLPAAAECVSIVDEFGDWGSQESATSHCPATSSNLAYVIYTSGSTGRPKGVMVEHRNALSFFAAMDLVLGAEAGVWLAVTSISFDISVLELIWTLTRGFKVVLHGEEGIHTIAEEIETHDVTHFQSTPSLARMLAAQPRSLAALASVKKLLVGGEALPSSLAAALRRSSSGEICNMYGPTETTVWSTVFRFPSALEPGALIPIGRPLANTRAYLLDPELRPVSDGKSGTLFLGGDGVVRGYRERPELTSERFFPDPFAGEGRMYCTGDVARRRGDGELEFLGRNDSQVKIRGYRVELGEIEAALEELSSVSQAVVVAREERPGDTRLVAYLVRVGVEPATPEPIRAQLASRLPEYMVPAHYVFLDALPRTPNGKLDRGSLAALPIERPASRPAPHSSNSPRRSLEQVITKVWAESLLSDEIGLDENIFDLGATSLMVPEVHAELQRILGREIPLIDLFQFHTVSTLAAHLAGDSTSAPGTNRASRRLAARRQSELL